LENSKLWQGNKLKQIRNREHLASWLVMVAGNCALNYLRCKKEQVVESSYDLELACPNAQEPGSILDQEKLTKALTKIMDSLPIREKIMVKLSFIHKKTHLEIANIFNLPQNTVSSVLSRTKQRIKEELNSQGW